MPENAEGMWPRLPLEASDQQSSVVLEICSRYLKGFTRFFVWLQESLERWRQCAGPKVGLRIYSSLSSLDGVTILGDVADLAC